MHTATDYTDSQQEDHKTNLDHRDRRSKRVSKEQLHKRPRIKDEKDEELRCCGNLEAEYFAACLRKSRIVTASTQFILTGQIGERSNKSPAESKKQCILR